MRQRRVALLLSSFLLLVAARQRAVQHPAGWPLTALPADKFSVAQPSQVTTRHLSLDLTVDFEKRQVRGTATLHIENLTGTTLLRLDAAQLNIAKVTLDGTTPATYTYKNNALDVTITPTTKTVAIEYSSNANGQGLFWHAANETFGGKEPFLYSQNEPNDARLWLPVQDTPSIRLTYDATIRVPRGMLALMSASDNARAANDTGVYMMHMPYRVPVYLLALVVGRIEFRDLDARTGVYAEPELIEHAAWELQYLPRMVDTAERIAGPFPFLRHDVAVMPPGYVVGGMEHPMLNTVTMSFVSHAKPDPVLPSSLIAHELSHSWAGDSSTLANWNDVWINEGITSYLTWRIIEEMIGYERAEYGWFNDRRGYQQFVDRASRPADSILHVDVDEPWQGFSSTGYIKGELFVKTLEDRIGRTEFDAFLRRYFQIFAFRWVDEKNFLALLRQEVLDRHPGLEATLQLNEWLYEAGIPSNITAPASATAQVRAQDRATRFGNGTPIASLDPQSWSALDISLFLQFAPIGPRMAEVDAALHLSSRVLPPGSWLVASIRNNYAPGNAVVDRLLASSGPRGTILLLYRELLTTPAGRERATKLFNLYRDRYDPQLQADIERAFVATPPNPAALPAAA